MKSFVYVPVLKAKRGEFVALKALRARVRTHVMPLIEALPASTKSKAQIPPENLVDRIEDACGTDFPVLVDHHFVSGEDEVIAGTVARFFAAAGRRIDAVPVISPASGPVTQTAVLNVGLRTRRIAVRLAVADIDSPASAARFLSHLVAETRIPRGAIDLLVDVGPVRTDIPEQVAIEVANRVGKLPALPEWRSLVLIAGAFPKDLSRFVPGMVGHSPRADWILWEHIRASRLLERTPDFGDYAIQHPDLPPEINAPVMPSPSIRYTAGREWLVMRGKRDMGDVARPDQFRQRCRELVDQEEFCGKFASEGDEFIARCAAGTVASGDPSMWRAVATDHHITFVCDQLAESAAR